MSQNSASILGGAIFILMGFCFVIFNRRIASGTGKFYSKFYHSRTGDRELQTYRIVFVLIGLIFAVFGVLIAFQLVPFQGD